MNTRQVGTKGEDIAAKYLAKHGYKIVERNFTSPHGEIDVVAREGKFIVFAEVKRRNTERFGLPREAVTLAKQKTIVACATFWLAKNKLFGTPVRFDVVEVIGEEVTVWKDAFRV